MNRFVSSRLAAQANILQVKTVSRLDSLGLALDRTIRGKWRQLQRLLLTQKNPFFLHQAVITIFRQLPGELRQAMVEQFRRLAAWRHQQVASANIKLLPLKILQAVSLSTPRPARRLQEAALPTQPGMIQLLMTQLGIHPLEFLSYGEELGGEEPGIAGSIAQDQRDYFSELLFPSPSEDRLLQIIQSPGAGLNWQQRLESITSLADPATMAAMIAGGFAQGESPPEIARDLLPLVDNVRSSAKRLARTEGMRIAHAVQMEANKPIDKYIIGWQIHATLDHWTRPWHALRNGQIFYKEPKGNQKGLYQMPHPPMEADDPAERPAGTPAVAYNCLLPGNYVQGRFLAGSKADYAGQAIELRCFSGNSIRVTPNHPILTVKGFIPANMIQEGDYLGSYLGSVQNGTKDEKNAPLPVEQVFSALKKFSSIVRRRPAAFIEFHGEAVRFKGQVEIVRAERKLLGCRMTEMPECTSYCLLVGAGVQAFLETSLSTENLTRLRINSTTAGIMRRSCLPLPSFQISDPTPFGLFRCGLVAERNPAFPKAFGQSQARQTAFFRKLIDRFPGKVALTQFRQIAGNDCLSESRGLCFTSQDDAGLSKPMTNRFPLFADTPAQTHARFAGKIALDQVINVSRFHYDGPVYDLETDIGYFIANREEGYNGIVLKNCRCVMSPVLMADESLEADPARMALYKNADDELITAPDIYSAWFSAAPEKEQRLAVGSRRYQAVRDVLDGQEPAWGHFIDPGSGDLMTIKQLQAEKSWQRQARLDLINRIMAERRQLLNQVQTFGQLLGQPA